MNGFGNMPVGWAIFAILTLFLAWWALVMARDPKSWRLWWMTRFGIPDMNSTRELRRRQEFHLSLLAYVAFTVLLAVGGSCAYWVIKEVQERRHPRTEYEQARDKTQQDLDKMRANKVFRKLN